MPSARTIALGGFQDFIEKQPGGLKALVAAERQARRPEPKPDTKGDAARARLRKAPPISLAELPADEEFAVVITRRGADGTHEPVAVVDDEALVERAIRKRRLTASFTTRRGCPPREARVYRPPAHRSTRGA